MSISETDKTRSRLISLLRADYNLRISAITEYEIYCNAPAGQYVFWDALLSGVGVLPVSKATAHVAVDLNKKLKAKSKQIAIADLFIAATAIENRIPFATLNLKHFERIDDLKIID